MTEDKCNFVRAKNLRMVRGSRFREGIVNPMCQIPEEKLSISSEDVQRADNELYSSLTRPLATSSSTSKLDMRNHQKGSQAIPRAYSFTSTRESLKGKSTLPGPDDFDKSWQNKDPCIHRLGQDTEPESLSLPYRKPFYHRTWFSCTIYLIVLAFVMTVILYMACYRWIIEPRRILKGEITNGLPVFQPDLAYFPWQQEQSSEGTSNDVPTPITGPNHSTSVQVTFPDANRTARPDLTTVPEPSELEFRSADLNSTSFDLQPEPYLDDDIILVPSTSNWSHVMEKLTDANSTWGESTIQSDAEFTLGDSYLQSFGHVDITAQITDEPHRSLNFSATTILHPRESWTNSTVAQEDGSGQKFDPLTSDTQNQSAVNASSNQTSLLDLLVEVGFSSGDPVVVDPSQVVNFYYLLSLPGPLQLTP